MAYQYDAERLLLYFGHDANLNERIKTGQMQTKAGTRLSTLPVSYTARAMKARLKLLDKQQKKMIDTSYLQLMAEFFEGKISGAHKPFMYWYFLEALIAQTNSVAGDKTSTLDNSEWCPAPLIPYHKVAEFSPYDFAPFESLERPDDFPLVLRVHNDKLNAIKKKVGLLTEDEAQQKQFLSWIDRADANKYDLFLFCY
jgi:hypothetical protein